MRRVAITGCGVISPIGCGRKAFFGSLREGRSGIGPITRFECGSFAVQVAGEVKDSFDWPESVARVAAVDRKVGYGFTACIDALGDAGMDQIGENTLLHLGTSVETFDLEKLVYKGKLDLEESVRRSLSDRGSLFQVPLDTTARLVTEQYGRPGLTLTNCSACAAGAQTVGHGFHEIRGRRFEKAVCGGFDSMVNPLGVGGFQLLGALTTDNGRGERACRPFDAARAGAVLGEGAAVFVLEPLEKAAAEGKPILAEIVGYGSSLDAYSLSAPDPEGDGAARSMVAALRDAQLRPEGVHHINTHGTGTRLNDEVEAKAIRHVFANGWERIPVSSTKSMTGHLIGASGAVEAAACLLPLLEGVLPPNPCLDKPGHGCELHHVVRSGHPFEGDTVLSNSFGFGGQNATLILRRHDG